MAGFRGRRNKRHNGQLTITVVAGNKRNGFLRGTPVNLTKVKTTGTPSKD